MAEPPIHVAHVLYRFAIGGLENGVVNLINGLDHARYRHSILCLTDYDPSFAARLNRVDVELHALGKREGNDPRLWARAFAVLRRLRPDVVHTRNFAALEIQLAAVAVGARLRVHGEHGWDVQDLDGSNRKYQLARRVMGTAVHRFVALSRHIEHYLTQVVGLAPRKVVRICNGVDDVRFHPRAEAPRGELVIGSVGRMKAVKNPAALCRAYAALLARRPDLRARTRLRLLGDGPLRAECLDIAAAGGCAANVECPGESATIDQDLRGMDLFVLPSLAEGISNTVLEAMASGLPVIATDVGGNAELVADGASGMLVPPGDEDALGAALERYVDAPELRAAHGARGRARVEREFSLAGMIAAYDRLYRERSG